MNLSITSPVRAALLALLVLFAPAALAGEDAPYPIWWSPVLEFESLDKIDERMKRKFQTGGDGIPVVKSDLPGDAEAFIDSCASYGKLTNEGYYAANNYTSKFLMLHTSICHAFEILASAKPAHTSYVNSFKFDQKAITFLPAMVSMSGSYDFACRQYVANERRISWSDFSIFEFEEIEVVHDYEMKVKTEGEHLTLQILARADFNNDGLEDIMLRVNLNSVGGTWGSTGIDLITRDSPNSVFWVIGAEKSLDPNYICDETYDYPDALRETN